jgi:hypothetical protein
MLLTKSSILLNILEYSNIYDLLHIYVLNTHSNDIISNSKFNELILKLKKRYINNIVLRNNTYMSDTIKNMQTACPHLYLLTSNKPDPVYITDPIYSRKCIICDYIVSRSKNIYHNRAETNWQYHLRNENIQHELIIRSDINKRPNIMNVLTFNLNSYYNNPANRYSYIRLNIVQKLNAIQLLILSYCDETSNLFLNKSWTQFMIRNKRVIQKLRIIRVIISSKLFENEIYNYKLNLLKSKRCIHNYKQSTSMCNIQYCIKCNHIDEYDFREKKRAKYVVT